MPSILQMPNINDPIVPGDLDDPNSPQIAQTVPPIPGIAQIPGATTVPTTTPTPTPTSYTPQQLQVDPASTVESRIGGIINKGGLLQQSAKTLAAQQSQQKGLLNTSMAVGAAQKAVIDSAMPIATEDARMSFAAQQANQAAANRALESESLFGQQTAIQDQKAKIDEKLLTASADEQMRLIAQRGELDTQLQNLRGQQAIEQIGEQGTVEERLVNRRGEIDKELQTADAATRSLLLQEQGTIDFDLVKAQGDEQRLLQAEAADINTQLETLRAGFKTEDAEAQRSHETELTNLQGDINKRLAEIRGDQDLVLQDLRGEQAVSLEHIKSEYDTILATQQSASILYANHIQAINEILANPDIPKDTKDSLIAYQIESVETALNVIAAMGGIDFGDLLGTSAITGPNDTPDSVTSPGVLPVAGLTPGPNFGGEDIVPGEGTYAWESR